MTQRPRPHAAASPLIAAIALSGVAFAAHAQVGMSDQAMRAERAAGATGATGAQRHLVVLKEGAGQDLRNWGPSNRAQTAMARSLDEMGVRNKRALRKFPAFSAELTAAQLTRLQRDPRVAYVEPDVPRFPLSLGAPPSDVAAASAAASTPAYMQGFSKASKPPAELGQRVPYGLLNTQTHLVPGADAQAGNMTVCVIDSGMDKTHPDLAANQASGSHDPDGSGWWYDVPDGHGTHVAGTIAALNNAGTGVVGVLPSGKLKLHLVKVFGKNIGDGPWTYSGRLIDAVEECAEAGAKVVNMSLGGGAPSKAEQAKFQEIADRGILLVAAAGNFGDKTISYPAGYAAVVAVGATDRSNRIASYSQYNRTIEWVAPGSDVLSTLPKGFGGEPSITVDGKALAAPRWAFGTPKTSVMGVLADFGDGTTVMPEMEGKICVSSRKPDDMDASKATMNCMKSKGVGIVVLNNAEGTQYAYAYPEGSIRKITIPGVTYSLKQGEALKKWMGKSATLTIKPADYGYYNGTSMASPHAAGIAALVWSHFPQCSAKQIREVIGATAKDLGDTGRDDRYGRGLVQAKAAVDKLAAEGCGP